jgi:hypothetical protein
MRIEKEAFCQKDKRSAPLRPHSLFVIFITTPTLFTNPMLEFVRHTHKYIYIRL